jgi:hypothetical protein
VEQDGAFSAQWDLEKVLLGLNARVQTLDGPDIDVGTRTRRTLFTLSANATYSISDKTSFEIDATGNVSDYATLPSSANWQVQAFGDYQIAPKTRVGVGVAAGIRTSQGTPEENYEQLLARATYNPTEKLSLRVNGGLEIDEGSSGANAVPIFGAGGTYTLDDADTMSLDIFRSVSVSSGNTAQDVETTGVNLSGRRRLFTNFSIQCSVGYQYSQYFARGLLGVNRTDNYIFIRPSLAYDFSQWSQIELAYEYHHDMSTQLPFDFTENLASLEIILVY